MKIALALAAALITVSAHAQHLQPEHFKASAIADLHREISVVTASRNALQETAGAQINALHKEIGVVTASRNQLQTEKAALLTELAALKAQVAELRTLPGAAKAISASLKLRLTPSTN